MSQIYRSMTMGFLILCNLVAMVTGCFTGKAFGGVVFPKVEIELTANYEVSEEFNVLVFGDNFLPGDEIGSYAFDLSFDDSTLLPLSVIDSAYSGLSPPPLIVAEDLTSPDVNFSVSSTTAVPANGALATIRFLTTATGTSTLTLNSVTLTDAAGSPITNFDIDPMSFAVTIVPEPSTGLLGGCALALLICFRNQKHRAQRAPPG
jgi:hypothetical protein